MILQVVVSVVLVSADPSIQTLEVFGQTVIVDSLTYFDNFTDINSDGIIDINDITAGTVVEVSGFADANGDVHATYISRKSDSFIPCTTELEIKGTISNLNNITKTFKIGSLTVNFNNATTIPYGLSRGSCKSPKKSP